MTKTQDTTRRKMKFLEFTFHEAKRMKSLGRIGVSKNYANSARQLQKYLATIKKKDVSLRKLSAGLLKDFEDWLHQNGVCRNTSSAYLRCLHTVWNRAAAKGLAAASLLSIWPTSARAMCTAAHSPIAATRRGSGSPYI